MNPNEAEDSFLTVAEVASILKLNQQTVRNWIDQGSLPALRVGRRVRIKRSDFERVLAESYTSGAGSRARSANRPMNSASATSPSNGLSFYRDMGAATDCRLRRSISAPISTR